MSVHLPLLSHSPWSPSKADMAARCALSFKYRYVEKLPGGPRGSPAKIGVTVHRAQELIFEGLEVREALDQAIENVDENLTHKEEEKARSYAASLLNFKEKVDKFSVKHPVKKLFLEQKWAVTSEFKPCDFFDPDGMIRGIVDMGLLLESGFLVIIDHKSGRLRPMSYYGTQLDVYAVMAHAYYPEVRGVQCALNFMASEKVTWGNPKSIKHIVEVLQPWLITYLNTRAESLVGYPARQGFHCRWCDYSSACPERINNDSGDQSK